MFWLITKVFALQEMRFAFDSDRVHCNFLALGLHLLRTAVGGRVPTDQLGSMDAATVARGTLCVDLSRGTGKVWGCVNSKFHHLWFYHDALGIDMLQFPLL